MKGYVFEKFREPNPLGVWMKMMQIELGMKQTSLVSLLDGSSSSQVSMMFSRNHQGPSFATGAGQKLIEAIIEEERSQWRQLWGKHAWGRVNPSTAPVNDYPRYPASRPRVLRQAAFALSLWNIPGNDVQSSNREFFEMLTMVPDDVYRQMVSMLGEPLYGPVLAKNRDIGRNKLDGKPRQEKEGFSWRRMRQDGVRCLIEAEREDRRDEIFDTKFSKLIRADDPHAAFQRVWERYEGLENERLEANEAALETTSEA